MTSGIMKALLQVLEWKAYEPTNITVSYVGLESIDAVLKYFLYVTVFRKTNRLARIALRRAKMPPSKFESNPTLSLRVKRAFFFSSISVFLLERVFLRICEY